MESEFDRKEAKKFLLGREQKEDQKREEERLSLLQRAISVLKDQFSGSGTQVFLVGSILRPRQFNAASDIDIVLKNFKGDRFQIWGQLEELLQRDIEIIIFEQCHFKEFIEKEGLKVVE